ncbi:hypothetical protein [Flavobacterium limicola]|uniref:hypothetical protein n=1 Tax=Flavobacterium limicola TaxID=180441 RepID=UPI0011C39A84|nr:hypothetical protein [Flavobacterium limicola]
MIAEVKKQCPNTKIIVFSIEDRARRIKLLFDELDINGYLIKRRNTIYDLKLAIQRAYNNELENVSPELLHLP